MRFLWDIIKKFLIIFIGSSVLAVVMYRYVPVYVTPLMVIRAVEQKQADKPIKLKHKWLSLDKISHNMVQAVVASEDNLFMEHNGFDFDQIEKAIKEAKSGKRNRGASTISQQTAKNVFLWNGGGWFRKGLEAYFTVLIELLWSKERIMEIYLNSIEMGYGIYGVEAVAKEHFNKKAAKLTKREAALIAATLPNPLRYNSANPSAYMRKRQRQIVSLMDKIAPVEMGVK
ncbi:MAG: monofunctional biosynthetic peptidoglycan transglycosylase [Muribaculaceae bacterium]|jgi:monofunctional biosynthetic peptidoglycan transglycosylase|nr:monofunctional biosynthetic peptidoglycan transglycosylase [Muribaculaceae bacterium]MEE1337936.1 monofunctional biosynthetic peptidoglycan transglycosylase [Muribaculaceae bacterium]